MKPLAIIVAICISGCAVHEYRKTWVRRDMPNQETINRDNIMCRQYGMQSATANGMAGSMFIEPWIRRESENCMRGLGYE